jgi:hypothetical protein
MNIRTPDARFEEFTADPLDRALHSLRSLGPKYPPHNANAPIMEGVDVAGLVAAVVITLGPLAACSLGMGHSRPRQLSLSQD